MTNQEAVEAFREFLESIRRVGTVDIEAKFAELFPRPEPKHKTLYVRNIQWGDLNKYLENHLWVTDERDRNSRFVLDILELSREED